MDVVALYNQVKDAVVIVEASSLFSTNSSSTATASGFFVRSQANELFVVTAAHVIEYTVTIPRTVPNDPDCPFVPHATITVLATQGNVTERLRTTVVGVCGRADVAVLRLTQTPTLFNINNQTSLEWGKSRETAVGSPVYTIGYPAASYPQHLQVGTMSDNRYFSQTLFNVIEDIVINIGITGGNSGGVLFDQNGRIVGISSYASSDAGVNAVAVSQYAAQPIFDMLTVPGSLSPTNPPAYTASNFPSNGGDNRLGGGVRSSDIPASVDRASLAINPATGRPYRVIEFTGDAAHPNLRWYNKAIMSAARPSFFGSAGGSSTSAVYGVSDPLSQRVWQGLEPNAPKQIEGMTILDSYKIASQKWDFITDASLGFKVDIVRSIRSLSQSGAPEFILGQRTTQNAPGNALWQMLPGESVRFTLRKYLSNFAQVNLDRVLDAGYGPGEDKALNRQNFVSVPSIIPNTNSSSKEEGGGILLPSGERLLVNMTSTKPLTTKWIQDPGTF